MPMKKICREIVLLKRGRCHRVDIYSIIISFLKNTNPRECPRDTCPHKCTSYLPSCNKNNKYICECTLTIFSLICFFYCNLQKSNLVLHVCGVIYFILIYVVIFFSNFFITIQMTCKQGWKSIPETEALFSCGKYLGLVTTSDIQTHI